MGAGGNGHSDSSTGNTFLRPVKNTLHLTILDTPGEFATPWHVKHKI